MHPRIGPSRCGEIADIIVDEEGVHTAEARPRLISLASDTEASYAVCSALGERPSRANAEIRTADLAPGGRLCVETDLRNIAMVRMDQVTADPQGQLEALTISFIVWSP